MQKEYLRVSAIDQMKGNTRKGRIQVHFEVSSRSDWWPMMLVTETGESEG